MSVEKEEPKAPKSPPSPRRVGGESRPAPQPKPQVEKAPLLPWVEEIVKRGK